MVLFIKVHYCITIWFLKLLLDFCVTIFIRENFETNQKRKYQKFNLKKSKEKKNNYPDFLISPVGSNPKSGDRFSFPQFERDVLIFSHTIKMCNSRLT